MDMRKEWLERLEQSASKCYTLLAEMRGLTEPWGSIQSHTNAVFAAVYGLIQKINDERTKLN